MSKKQKERIQLDKIKIKDTDLETDENEVITLKNTERGHEIAQQMEDMLYGEDS